jgi:hypothetical protein
MRGVPLNPKWMRNILAVELAGFFFAFAFVARHWLWMNDAQVPHYIIFLMRHGLSPYRQIIDINLPGSYLSEWIGMSFPGGSDLGWRLYDYFLLAILTCAAMVIARTYDWFAGLYAGILFALIHGSEGPWFAADRDEAMTVLIFCGYALAFIGTRRRLSLYFCLSALALGIACSIKPTAAVAALFLFVPCLLHLRKLGVRVLPFLREIVIGGSLTLLANLIFLLWRGSFHDFLTRVPPLMRYYSSMGRTPFSVLLHYSTPRGLIFLLPLIVVLFFRNRSWRDWECQAILGGVLFGLISYFAQGKGFSYHRYSFAAFCLLLGAIEFVRATRASGAVRWVGLAGILIGSLLIAPFYFSRVLRVDMPDAIAKGIIEDLKQIPPEQLQKNVQCLDSVYGCYSALYRLQLQQSTGLMGDQLLFPHKVDQTILDLRGDFWRQIVTNPPRIFIETNAWPWGEQTFTKVEAWPEFSEFLRKNYTIISERTFSESVTDLYPAGYRIYRRNH